MLCNIYSCIKTFASVERDMANEPTIELDPLATRLEEALLVSGMSQTRFSYTHFGDPAFVKKMREGRRFRRPMAEKVEAVLLELGV